MSERRELQHELRDAVKYAVLVAALVACSSESQIVIVLEGDLEASSYEVILAESQVFLKRNQRSNQLPPGPRLETAFYVVQRHRIDVVLDQPTALSGLELQLVGADGALPIVKAFDKQGTLIGMGILDPARVFRDDDENDENFPNRLEAIEEITRYPIVVEPVTVPSDTNGKTVPVLEGEVLAVRCQDSLSGLAWRPRSSPDHNTGQLRIILPQGDSLDAGPRVEAAGLDLDCDAHTPVLRGMVADGDQADCDDTASIVFGGEPPAPETCDRLDTDCDASTAGSEVIRAGCPAANCLGSRLDCYEAADTIANNGCPELNGCHACQLVFRSNGTGQVAACESRGEIVLPSACGDQCVARLVAVDPQWTVRIGDVDDPRAGLNRGHLVVGNKIGIAITQNPSPGVSLADFTGIVIALQPTPNAPAIVIEVMFLLEGSNETTTCDPLEQISCGPA